MSMMPTGWDPFGDLTSMQRTVDRLINGAFGSGERDRRPGTAYLPLNVRESPSGYEVEAPVPGFAPSEVDVSFADGVLAIKAEHQEQATVDEGQTLAREFVWGSAARRLTLSGDVDTEHIEANIDNGLLKVYLPKASRSLPRRIPIGEKKDEASPQLARSSS